MTTFLNRLLQACAHAGVEGKQVRIAEFLGEERQTVNYWFRHGGTPEREKCRQIAQKLGVRYEWLAFGQGEMLDIPRADSLDEEERKLLKAYRSSTPKGRVAIVTMAMAARKLVMAATLALLFGLVHDSSAATLQNGTYHEVSFTKSLNLYTIYEVLRRWIVGIFLTDRRGFAW